MPFDRARCPSAALNSRLDENHRRFYHILKDLALVTRAARTGRPSGPDDVMLAALGPC